jgi:hypothetical protein
MFTSNQRAEIGLVDMEWDIGVGDITVVTDTTL